MLVHSNTKRLVLIAVLGAIAISNSACLGKGKGKAPPPPPMAAPIVRKG